MVPEICKESKSLYEERLPAEMREPLRISGAGGFIARD